MNVYAILTSAGVGGLVALVVAWLAKLVITEKVRARIQHEYNERLESYRGSIRAAGDAEVQRLLESADQVRSLHAAAVGSVLESNSAAQERRLKAVETIWRAMVRLRMITPGPVILSDIFTEEEYQNGVVCCSDVVRLPLRSLTLESFAKQLSDTDEDVQLARAFGTEYLYALFFAYRSLIGGITMKFFKGVGEGRMKPWFRDDGILRLLASIFPDAELRALDASPAYRFMRLQEAIEKKMLAHINDILTGRAMSQSALEHAGTMMAAAIKVHSQLRMDRDDIDR